MYWFVCLLILDTHTHAPLHQYIAFTDLYFHRFVSPLSSMHQGRLRKEEEEEEERTNKHYNLYVGPNYHQV